MKLNKNHIEIIDNHLKSLGIKYWDIRIEMIDHIATDIEQNAESDDFTIELKNSLNHLGWLGNLSYLNTKGWKDTNDFYRKKYFNQIIDFLKKPKIFLLTAFFVFVNILLSNFLSFKSFKIVQMVFFILPILPLFYYWIKNAFKKYGRSVHLDYGILYSSFSILMVNLPLYFIDAFDVIIQKIIILTIMPIYLLASYSGFLLYKSAIKKVETMKKELSL